MSILSEKHFHNETAAYKYVEARLWPEGRVCPHCGVIDRSGALKGKTTREGLYKCYACRKPFSSSSLSASLYLRAQSQTGAD